MKRKLNVKLLFVIAVSFVLSHNEITAQEILSSKLIWKGDNYAAFTSLVYYKGYYYCAFRDANKHVDSYGEDCGVIRIIKSRDARDWTEFLVFEEPRYDLRDPKLIITPNHRLMLLTEKVLYKNGKATIRNTCTSIIRKNGKHTPLSPIGFKPDQDWNWLWNLEWVNNVAYGFMYIPHFYFVKSENGHDFIIKDKLNLHDRPTESSVAKINKTTLLGVVRGDTKVMLGEYDLIHEKWEWKDGRYKIGCPKIIKVKNEVYIVGRSYDKGLKTTIFRYNQEEKDVERLLDIDGSKDFSYPGAVYRKGKLYVTYYLGDGYHSDIHLSIIKL